MELRELIQLMIIFNFISNSIVWGIVLYILSKLERRK